MLLLTAGFASAAVLFGGAWAPVGIGAFAWNDADNFSGTLAGEYDGLLRPPLTAHAGWAGPRSALLGNVAVVQFTTARYADTTSLLSVGGLRLGLDYRRYLWEREPGAVNLYGAAGLYGIVPNAANNDEAYTAAEQEAADEGAGADRSRVGGFGPQLGVGAEYVFPDAKGRPAVALGVRWLTRLYYGFDSVEGANRMSTVVLSEAAFVLEFTR